MTAWLPPPPGFPTADELDDEFYQRVRGVLEVNSSRWGCRGRVDTRIFVFRMFDRLELKYESAPSGEKKKGWYLDRILSHKARELFTFVNSSTEFDSLSFSVRANRSDFLALFERNGFSVHLLRLLSLDPTDQFYNSEAAAAINRYQRCLSEPVRVLATGVEAPQPDLALRQALMLFCDLEWLYPRKKSLIFEMRNAAAEWMRQDTGAPTLNLDVEPLTRPFGRDRFAFDALYMARSHERQLDVVHVSTRPELNIHSRGFLELYAIFSVLGYALAPKIEVSNGITQVHFVPVVDSPHFSRAAICGSKKLFDFEDFRPEGLPLLIAASYVSELIDIHLDRKTGTALKYEHFGPRHRFRALVSVSTSSLPQQHPSIYHPHFGMVNSYETAIWRAFNWNGSSRRDDIKLVSRFGLSVGGMRLDPKKMRLSVAFSRSLPGHEQLRGLDGDIRLKNKYFGQFDRNMVKMVESDFPLVANNYASGAYPSNRNFSCLGYYWRETSDGGYELVPRHLFYFTIIDDVFLFGNNSHTGEIHLSDMYPNGADVGYSTLIKNAMLCEPIAPMMFMDFERLVGPRDFFRATYGHQVRLVMLWSQQMGCRLPSEIWAVIVEEIMRGHLRAKADRYGSELILLQGALPAS